MSKNTPVLTIAGVDPSGGSGLAADLKTFAAHGCYGQGVCTSAVACNTARVGALHLLPEAHIAEQLEFVFADIPPLALKTGLLSLGAINATIAAIERYRPQNVVIDPVMFSKSGFRLIADAEFALYRSRLCALADVITPNRLEAQLLLGREISTAAELAAAARDLAALGAKTVLAKGGKALGGLDIFFDGRDIYELQGELIAGTNDHGAGCTLSAAIAANLAQGASMLEAVRAAKKFTEEAIRTAPGLGRLDGGHGPLNHLCEHI